MANSVQIRTERFIEYGLPADATLKQIQIKINELKKEVIFLDLVCKKLFKQTSVVGAKWGNLNAENERLQLPIDSARRLFMRVKYQFKAFCAGSSLTEEKRINPIILKYLDDEYETLRNELSSFQLKLATSKVRILTLEGYL